MEIVQQEIRIVREMCLCPVCGQRHVKKLSEEREKCAREEKPEKRLNLKPGQPKNEWGKWKNGASQ